MSAEYTKGPWAYALEYGPNVTEPPRITAVARCANYVIGLPSDYPGGNYRDGDPSGDEEADARLIAAAPDLLEALVDAEAALRQMDKTIEWEFGDCRSDDEMEADKAWSTQVYTARAAIAKAKGEQG